VYYCHQATPQEQARAGFGVEFEWDVPLLSGYPHSFLRNIAHPPGHGRFAGFDTPEIGKIIRRRDYDAVLVNGWNYKSAWQAIWAAWQSDVRVFVRGDSHLHSPRSRTVRATKLLAYRRFVPCFDACLAAGEWSREYFAYYGARPDRIFFVQLGDAPRMNVDPLTLRRNHSRMPGEGDFDVAGFLRAVLATGYSGTVSLEIFNEKTPESPLASARAAMHSMLLVEERARGANERESSKPVAVGASKPQGFP